MQNKKEYIIVIAIVLVVSISAFIISIMHPQVEIRYAEDAVVLNDEDFTVHFSAGIIQIGSSTWDDVVDLLPAGHNLGMSTLYRPDNLGCLLTFTRKENVLSEIHFESPVLATSRGVRVGDKFSQVTKLYGPEYSSVNVKGKNSYFDAVYGDYSENCLVFQVKKNQVTKIIIQKQP
ncbi:MAG: hypothetical protein PHT79_03750 [Syntrophomonadaceae bacterium]|nr:hypothetical protein [Syntrophomonadaceae bacterium]MDD4548858.1 hypothetical protein [Syntrophomonadaceae bacterium]